MEKKVKHKVLKKVIFVISCVAVLFCFSVTAFADTVTDSDVGTYYFKPYLNPNGLSLYDGTNYRTFNYTFNNYSRFAYEDVLVDGSTYNYYDSSWLYDSDSNINYYIHWDNFIATINRSEGHYRIRNQLFNNGSNTNFNIVDNFSVSYDDCFVSNSVSLYESYFVVRYQTNTPELYRLKVDVSAYEVSPTNNQVYYRTNTTYINYSENNNKLFSVYPYLLLRNLSNYEVSYFTNIKVSVDLELVDGNETEIDLRSLTFNSYVNQKAPTMVNFLNQRQLPSPSVLTWLGEVLDGVFNVDIFGTFGLGDLVLVVLGTWLTIIVIKFFAGG